MILDEFKRGVPSRDFNKHKTPRAEWEDPAKIVADKDLIYNIHDPKGKILLGNLDEKLIGVEDDRHMITCAGSRAGKFVSVLAPNLIFYPGSILIIDPKGEAANATAKRRAEALGQEVHILDPFDLTVPELKNYKSSFNPLSILSVNSSFLIEDTGLITDALVVPGDGKDVHWDECAKNFIEGVILHVVTHSKYDNCRDLVTVHDLIAKGTNAEDAEGNPLLYTVENQNFQYIGMMGLYIEMQTHGMNLEEHATSRVDEEVGSAICTVASDMDEKPQDEQGSVLSATRRHLKFLGIPRIKNVIKKRDFKLKNFKMSPKGMTVYLCLPAGRLATCSRWLRIFVNLTLEAMERVKKRPKFPVLFILDEFATLGQMKQIENAAGQIAGFGVKLWPIIQDLTQLKAIYRDRWETFMANSGILQFFGNNDYFTLKYIQDRLGKTSVLVRSTSSSSTDKQRGITGEESKIELHDLITAEEAGRLFAKGKAGDEHQCQLVIHSYKGRQPMVLYRLLHYKHPDIKGKFVNYYNKTFLIEEVHSHG